MRFLFSKTKKLFPAKLKHYIKSKIILWRPRLWRRSIEYFKKNTLRELHRIGTTYGGWTVPVDLIAPDWICYCAGVGEDITFDLGLIERFGVDVYAFDPTPRAIAHVQKTASDNPKYHFYPYGLWSSNTEMKFFAPSNPLYVSHSILNLRGTSDYFVADCKRLSTIMDQLNHQRIDLLKMDIEGAEYAVINSILQDNLDIKVLCVEFDQPDTIFNWNGIRTFINPILAIWRLHRRGYRLINFEDMTCTLISKDLI